MQKFNTILLRYGELFLKGNNKYQFESVLVKNIKAALRGIGCEFVRAQGRYFVENIAENDMDEAITRLKRVFGLHSLSPCIKVKTDLDAMRALAAEIVPKTGKFRVTVNRADKRFALNSTDTARDLGGYILQKHKDLKVNLHDFDIELTADIRENGYTYMFCERVLCEGGLPVGTAGTAALLLSGGIDSPVAGYLMAKRGLKIFGVHFHSFPYTSELALEKVKDLAKQLTKYLGGKMRLAVVHFTEVQRAIHKHCRADYMITVMRRIMLRIAGIIAKNAHGGALVTGESLGQVASQTVESITVTNAVAELPVFRPLIGADKEEIIAIARKIGTFDISIRPYEDCCTVFLPDHPVIRPTVAEAEKQEGKLSLEALIEKAVKDVEMIEIE